MFGKNQAREKLQQQYIQRMQEQAQEKAQNKVSDPLHEQPVQKYTLREMQNKVQYGKGEYISFANFAQSTITHHEKLFTRKFVMRAYANLFDAAIISGSNNPFSYRAEMCLWIKSKMDVLIVSDIDKTQEFVAYLKKFYATVEQFDAPTEHQAKFLMTLEGLFAEVIGFVNRRCPLLVDKLQSTAIEKKASILPEFPEDFPKSELIGRVGRDDYVVSDIKDGASLFTASFAENVYKKLIEMSQKCGSTRMLYRYDACVEIKELIERSKVDWDSYRAVIVKIPSEIRSAAAVSGTEQFVATLSEILKEVVDYVAMVHPELEKSRQDCLRKLVEESSALKNDLLAEV